MSFLYDETNLAATINVQVPILIPDDDYGCFLGSVETSNPGGMKTISSHVEVELSCQSNKTKT